MQTGKTGRALEVLKRDFKGVVKDVPTDFQSAGKAVSFLNQRLDVTGKPLQRISKQMLELSRITGTDLEENMEAATRVLADFGVKVNKQPRALDRLFRVSQATGVSFSDLATNMVKFGSPLRQLGFNFNTTAAMFAKFQKEGVNISTAIPGLRLALGNFAEAGKEPAQALNQVFEAIRKTHSAGEAYRVQIGSLGTVLQVFGKRAGADLVQAVREGRFSFEDLVKAMKTGDDTILRAAKDTRDFSENWQIFKNRVMVGLEPLAIRVFDAVGRAMKRIGDILTDKDLSTGEKVGQLFSGAAEAAGKAGGKAAVAFVKGLWNADIWGKLAGGAIIAGIGAKLAGGWGKLGGIVGKKWGLAFLLALETMELGKQIKQIIEGHALGQTRREEFATTLSEFGFDSKTFVGRNKVRVATDMGDLIFNAQTRQVIGAKGKQLQGLIGKTAAQAYDALNKIRKPKAATAGIERDFSILGSKIRTQLQTIPGITRKAMAKVEAALKNSPEKGRVALAREYDRMVAKIKRAMEAGRISTQKGMAKIERLTQAKLSLYGIGSIQEAVKGAGGPLFGTGGGGGGGGGGGSHQTGAMVVPGTGSGDKVPIRAMVEPGEALAVLNRNAAKAWMAWNSAFPRFRKGGVEGPEPGGKRKAGSRMGKFKLPRWAGQGAQMVAAAAGLNLTAGAAEKLVKKAAGGNLATVGDIVALGHALQRRGYAVGEHPKFGGVQGGHTAGSWHYKGRAIDVNHDQGDEMSALDAIYAPLRRNKNVIELLWRVKDHFDHLHVAMQKGGTVPAPKRGKKWLPLSTQGGPGDKHMSVDEGATLLWQAGLSRSQASQLARVLPGESGGQNVPNSAGSGASGYFQIMMPLHRGIVGRHGGNVWDYRTNVMSAVDIFRSQGFGAWEAARSGPPGKILRKAVQALGGVGNKIKRAKKLKGKIKQGVLPKKLQATIDDLTALADRYGEYADRANQLEGPVLGAYEIDWLKAELQALFDLRNALVRAHELLATAAQELTEKIASLKGVKGKKKTRKKLRENLGLVNSKMSEIGETLAEIQGTVAPELAFKRLSSLPAVGDLGGRIFEVQMAIREAGETASATDTGTDERAELLRELLRQSQLGKLIAERQYPILKGIPQLVGSYAGGGVIPGPTGQAQVAEVHGGEGVFTREQMAAMGGPGTVEVVIHGDVVPLEDRVGPVVEVFVDKKLQREASIARRRL